MVNRLAKLDPGSSWLVALDWAHVNLPEAAVLMRLPSSGETSGILIPSSRGILAGSVEIKPGTTCRPDAPPWGGFITGPVSGPLFRARLHEDYGFALVDLHAIRLPPARSGIVARLKLDQARVDLIAQILATAWLPGRCCPSLGELIGRLAPGAPLRSVNVIRRAQRSLWGSGAMSAIKLHYIDQEGCGTHQDSAPGHCPPAAIFSQLGSAPPPPRFSSFNGAAPSTDNLFITGRLPEGPGGGSALARSEMPGGRTASGCGPCPDRRQPGRSARVLDQSHPNDSAPRKWVLSMPQSPCR